MKAKLEKMRAMIINTRSREMNKYDNVKCLEQHLISE